MTTFKSSHEGVHWADFVPFFFLSMWKNFARLGTCYLHILKQDRTSATASRCDQEGAPSPSVENRQDSIFKQLIFQPGVQFVFATQFVIFLSALFVHPPRETQCCPNLYFSIYLNSVGFFWCETGSICQNHSLISFLYPQLIKINFIIFFFQQ